MKRVSILVPNGQFSIVNIAGAFQILEAANTMQMQKSGEQLFNLELVASTNPVKDLQGLYQVYPSKTIYNVKETDLIIVPAVHEDIAAVLESNKDSVNWIKANYNEGAEVASFCVGVYLLAEAGILDGKACSTHWSHAQDLKQRFPALNIMVEHFITDDRGVYTCGGAYSFPNLILYLIEKFAGRHLAVSFTL